MAGRGACPPLGTHRGPADAGASTGPRCVPGAQVVVSALLVLFVPLGKNPPLVTPLSGVR